jgi:hypothetical protein
LLVPAIGPSCRWSKEGGGVAIQYFVIEQLQFSEALASEQDLAGAVEDAEHDILDKYENVLMGVV